MILIPEGQKLTIENIDGAISIKTRQGEELGQVIISYNHIGINEMNALYIYDYITPDMFPDTVESIE